MYLVKLQTIKSIFYLYSKAMGENKKKVSEKTDYNNFIQMKRISLQ